MNLSERILKGYKSGEKNNSSVNIRFAAKSWDIRIISQNIRSGNTDAYHPRVHIRKIAALWRINYTSIDTVCSSTAKLVSTLAGHGNTQLLLYMVVQTTQEWRKLLLSPPTKSEWSHNHSGSIRHVAIKNWTFIQSSAATNGKRNGKFTRKNHLNKHNKNTN